MKASVFSLRSRKKMNGGKTLPLLVTLSNYEVVKLFFVFFFMTIVISCKNRVTNFCFVDCGRGFSRLKKKQSMCG